MSETFRSLADLLRDPDACAPGPPVQECAPEAPAESADAEALLADVRVFHARLAERVDEALALLLDDIAAAVLARELQIAPAEIGRIVECALAQFENEQPVRVRVAPADAARVRLGVPVLADPSLREGDAAIDVRDGCLDLSLGVRLDAVLRAALP